MMYIRSGVLSQPSSMGPNSTALVGRRPDHKIMVQMLHWDILAELQATTIVASLKLDDFENDPSHDRFRRSWMLLC